MMRPAIWSTFWMSLGLNPSAASELFSVCNCAATVRAPGDAALAALADDALAVVVAAVPVGCASKAVGVAVFTLEAAAPFPASVGAVVTVLLSPLAAAEADLPSVAALCTAAVVVAAVAGAVSKVATDAAGAGATTGAAAKFVRAAAARANSESVAGENSENCTGVNNPAASAVALAVSVCDDGVN